MAKKRAFISPYNEGALKSLPFILSTASEITGRTAPDVHSMLLTSLFQAGVDEFVASNLDIERLPGVVMPSFLSEKFVPLSMRVWNDKTATLRGAFQEYLPRDYQFSDEYGPVAEIESLLADLLYALEEQVSLVVILDPPDELDLKDLLPDELMIPVRNLLASFRDESAEVLVPRTTVASENVERYAEILDSDLFRRYSKAQLELDFVETSLEKALQHVSSAARQLQKKAKKLIRSTRARLTVLSLAPEVVEAGFGRFPGRAADALLSGAEKGLAGGRRIVIYHLERQAMELCLSSLVRIFGTRQPPGG